MKGITDRQKEVLTFISSYTDENGYPPTVREISEHFEISIRAVQDHILALQKKGFLSQSQKRARSIRVLSDCREKEPEAAPDGSGAGTGRRKKARQGVRGSRK